MSDSRAVSGSREGDRGNRRTGPVAFLRQVLAELRKVVWPTRNQLFTYFVVVMVFVVVMMAIISLLDLGFGNLAYEVFAGDQT